MEKPIHVTLEFTTGQQSSRNDLPEGLLALGAAFQKLSQNKDLARHFSVPTDVPLQLEIRHQYHPAHHGHQHHPAHHGEQQAEPTLRVIIDAPQQHAESMRAAVHQGVTEAIQKSLTEVQPEGVSLAALGFAAGRPAKLEFVFK